MSTIQERIKQVRKTLKMTLAEMAKELESSTTSINSWELGRNNMPMSVRKQLTLQYNVNREWLETGKGPMFLQGKSPDKLDLEAFERVVFKLFDDLSDEGRLTIVDLGNKLAKRYAELLEEESSHEEWEDEESDSDEFENSDDYDSEVDDEEYDGLDESGESDEYEVEEVAPEPQPVKRGRGRPRKNS